MTYDLSSLGWDEEFAAAYAPLNRSDALPARVLRAVPGVCTVITADGVARASLAGSILLGAVRDPGGLPCAGDWVVVRRWPDRRCTVDVVLPRRTALTGVELVGGNGASRVLAANMDVVAVVEPMRPAPDLARLEGLLAMARASGAHPVVVLTKSDTVHDPATVLRRVERALPGVSVLPVGGQHGTEALAGFVVAGRTLGLLGRARAGRSTLVGTLASTSVLAAARKPDGSVHHRVAYRMLMPVPGGGAVLDVPDPTDVVDPATSRPAAPVADRSATRLAAVAGTRPRRTRPRH